MLVRVFDFTDEQKEAFVEGWKKAGGYVGDSDSPYPWCCPWELNDEIEVEGNTPEEMGADWWRRSKAEIEALIAEEDEARAEVEEEEFKEAN